MQTKTVIESVTLEDGEHLTIFYKDHNGHTLEVRLSAGPGVLNKHGEMNIAGLHVTPGSRFQKLDYALTSRDDDYE